MRIAIAGASGTVGRHAVRAATERGHEVVALTRASGVNVLDTSAVRVALDGVDAVVDVLNIMTPSARKATGFFTAATMSLLDAGAQAGVRHHVALSIVGIDRAPHGYYAAKLAQEQAVAAGSVLWTVQRATQFHDFAALMYGILHAGPFRFAPRGRVRPVDTGELGEYLVVLAEGEPQGIAPDFAGPREESLARMVQDYARAQGYRRKVPEISVPGALGRAQRDGSLLPRPGAVLAERTFDEWLEKR
ncbi:MULTISPECIES: NAD(P)H-binding protein [Arthrobacter]|uniref:NAD(P)H-binding protein n=2 Tax=Arthrobacter TaxID=1663 RepID=A0ABU9KIJ0_9MICC|nr:NAD(P)H-binding protein [Arthrobacter sp. YJM1]MDP5227041.1 NAD(P)H-binding protein [Arthrobacter sp. YJM1]